MDVQSWTAVFVGIVAFSFLLQSLAIFGIYSRLKQVASRVDEMTSDVKKQLGAVSSSVQQSLESAKPILDGVQRLNENLLSISTLVKERAIDLDRLTQETTETLRTQLVRVDEVVDDTTSRMRQVVETWQRGILAPTHELTALIKAVKTGINFFFSRKGSRYSSPSQSDEELFI